MRRVFSSHSEVCHVWAQQTQSEGKAGNIFFAGKSIYSYGRHFEMARFIDEETVFITSRGYSVSTAKHLSIVRRAVSHKTVFEVPSFTDHAENVAHFITSAREQFDKAKRARTHVTWCISSAHQYRDKASEYIARFGYAVVPAEHIELWNAIQTGTYLDGDVQAALLKKEREAKKAEQEAASIATTSLGI